MACIQPLTFFQKSLGRSITVPCNHCLQCLIRKQSQIEFLAKKELLEVYKNNQGACFVTFTYQDSYLPLNDKGYVTLRKRDLQLFMKGVRRNMEYHHFKKPFKYIACGELGDSFSRPHYHVVFLGITDDEMKVFARKVWKYGLIDIGPLTQGGLSYVCKYMSKSKPSPEVKLLREIHEVENPFLIHSIGLGKKWINEHINDIVENRFIFNINGKKCLFPKYVMQYVKSRTGIDYKPFVIDFITKSENYLQAKSQNISYIDFTNEFNYLNYKMKVEACRSRGLPVDDITLSKKWVRPKSHTYKPYSDKKIHDLVDLAIYGDVVPF